MIRIIILFVFGLLPFALSAQSEVFIDQPGLQRSGTERTNGEIILLQSGQLNQIQLQNTGSSNTISLQQQGINNVLDLDIAGSDSRYSFAQLGDNNLTQWRSGQQTNQQLEVLQRGDNNQLLQEGGSSTSGVSMRIEQTGGMQLRIQNGFSP